MKLFTSTAIVLAAGIFAAPAAAQYGSAPTPPPQTAAQTGEAQAPASQGPKITISSKASKAIGELQAAVKANDVANIPAKVAAANAVAQTKDDRYAIAQFQLTAAVASKNTAAEAQAVEAMAASGVLGAERLSQLYTGVGAEFYNAKQYDQASALFQKAASLNPQSAEPLKLLSQAYLAQGNKAQASATLMKVLQMSRATGQKPEQSLYKNAVAMAYEAKSPNAIELAREWVAAYPSPDSWSNALAIYRNLQRPATSLDVLRLARATNTMSGTGEFHEYAYEAADEANYGEAKAVIAEGIASGKIKATDPVIQEVQGVLKSKAAPTAADLAAAEKSAREPQAFLRVGDRYYGAGNFAKAADLYRQALAKGVDKDVANLRIGEALARSGDKAGATAALNAVSGSLAEIAKFWLIYLQQA
jgi:tetratricopeptide (TPR) repeat protein